MRSRRSLCSKVLLGLLIGCLCFSHISLPVGATEVAGQMQVFAYDSLDEFNNLSAEERTNSDHSLWTVGNILPVAPTDADGNIIADFSDNPQAISLSYDDSYLTAIGATSEDAQNLGVYYYQDGVGYVYVGGTVDPDNHVVYANVGQSGYYILLLRQGTDTEEENEDEEAEDEETEDEETEGEKTEEEQGEEETAEPIEDEQQEQVEPTPIVEEPTPAPTTTLVEDNNTLPDTTVNDTPDVVEDTEFSSEPISEVDEESNQFQSFMSKIGVAAVIICIVSFLFAALMIFSFWKIFEKAGEAGWKSLIPIWNCVVLAKISTGKPLLALLLFIPFVNFVAILYMYYRLNRAFAGGTLSFILMIFVPFYVFPLLALSSEAEYMGYDYIPVYDDEDDEGDEEEYYDDEDE